MNVESQKVDYLAGTIYLCLENILTLAKHGSPIHIRAIFCSNKIRGLQENISTLFPTHACPGFLSCQRCANRLFNVSLVTGVIVAERVGFLVRRMNRQLLISANFFVTDIHGYIRFLTL